MTDEQVAPAEVQAVTYCAWAALPNDSIRCGYGWSRVASGLTKEQADMYKSTFVFEVSVQEEQADGSAS